MDSEASSQRNLLLPPDAHRPWTEKYLPHIKITTVREFLAELVGTFVFVLVGMLVNSQATFSGNLGVMASSDITVGFGWAMAVMMGVIISGGVSGGHINPAVTTAMVVVGKLPWWKMFHYMLAQYLGAFLAAALAYGNYIDAHMALKDMVSEDAYHALTAGIFGTFPNGNVGIGNAFLDQALGTGILLFMVLAITDSKNMKIKSSLVPLYVGLVILALTCSMGFNCGGAVNPARDLGPRVFSSMAGWGGDVFTAGDNFSWVPVVAAHVGGAIGAFIYVMAVENHWPREKDELKRRFK